MSSRSFLWALALGLAGCGGPEIAPSAEAGRDALAAALDAWKAGTPCGEIPGRAPRLIAVDSSWQSGARLQSFELLGPVEGSTPPRFRASLTLEGAPAPAPAEATYVLVGSDPLYVYRDADFDRMVNMDNNPGGAPKPR